MNTPKHCSVCGPNIGLVSVREGVGTFEDAPTKMPGTHQVVCAHCGSAGPRCGSADRAIELWDRAACGDPLPGSPAWEQMHTQVAVMARGQRRSISAYLREVADSIDKGCTSGISGDANPARGSWFCLR